MSDTAAQIAAPPLAGIRILDLSRVLAGPWCTMVLGDLGAEVTKIEQPGLGDDTRRWGPPYVENESAYFLCANRNKKSVEVDLSAPKGQAIIRAMAAEADVVVENFKAGGLARYGLDYAALSAINPRLVYCAISGYGRTGPDALRPGYDFVVQAEDRIALLFGAAGVPGGGYGGAHQGFEGSDDLREQRVAAGAGDRLMEDDIVAGYVSDVGRGGHRLRRGSYDGGVGVAAVASGEFGGA